MTKENLEKTTESPDLQLYQQLHQLKDEAYFRYQLLLELVGIRGALELQAEAMQKLSTPSEESK